MNDEILDQLLAAATVLVNERADDNIHTVAAAVLTEEGQIITSLNLFHFTGGPDAEIAALARVASEAQKPVAVVAVGHNGRGILAPCGKCRQIMFDYYPNMQIVLPNKKLAALKDLLPYVYSWYDQQ